MKEENVANEHFILLDLALVPSSLLIVDLKPSCLPLILPRRLV